MVSGSQALIVNVLNNIWSVSLFVNCQSCCIYIWIWLKQLTLLDIIVQAFNVCILCIIISLAFGLILIEWHILNNWTVSVIFNGLFNYTISLDFASLTIILNNIWMILILTNCHIVCQYNYIAFGDALSHLLTIFCPNLPQYLVIVEGLISCCYEFGYVLNNTIWMDIFWTFYEHNYSFQIAVFITMILRLLMQLLNIYIYNLCMLFC